VSEPTKRGRRPAPNPRKLVSLYLTDAELAEVQGYNLGSVPLGPFLRDAALRWLRSQDARYERYHDSGQAVLDEAADIAEDLAAAK
jgi:hypothetical protein